MPEWRVHAYVDRMLFGRSYRKIHENIDSAVGLFGRGHRIFFHDPTWANIIAQGCYPNDPNAVCAAYVHAWLDQVCSSDPSFKATLEILEMLDRKKRKKKGRKKKRKQKPKMDEESARWIGDLEKMEEIRRLQSIILGR